MCLKNDRKSLNVAFGREFLSDEKISQGPQLLTERPCNELNGPNRTGSAGIPKELR